MADRLLFSKTGTSQVHLPSGPDAHLPAGLCPRRASTIKHTEGFNPHPFVSIALPLSVGYSSQCEILEFGLLGGRIL